MALSVGPFEARSVPLAFRAMQEAALPHIAQLAYEGGATVDLSELSKYQYTGRFPLTAHHGDKEKSQFSQWNIPGERDNILFLPMAIEKMTRDSGIAVPYGEFRDEAAVVQNVHNPSNEAIEVGVEYHRNRTLILEESSSMTHGWSLSTSIEAQAGGGESSGGSYVKAGVTAEVHGEYAEAHSRNEAAEQGISLTSQVEVPPQALRVIQQLVRIGKTKVDFVDKMQIDLGFWVVDWKHLSHRHGKPGFLSGNRDWSDWKDTKSRVVMKVDDMLDLYSILTGQNPDYPHARGQNLLKNQFIRESFDYFEKPENRTIIVKSTGIFEESVYGDLILDDAKD